ncbi:MAG: sensor histidine kinase [Lachnospiraceae bacterium]|nr:sensor histidine kinase [Lachnospiraceae bacterium]
MKIHKDSKKKIKEPFSRQSPLGFLRNANIKQQLYTIYVLAILIPIALIGSFLLVNTSRLLMNYHRDLLESDNLRVKTILFEITTQLYNLSEEISFDNTIQDILSQSGMPSSEQLNVIDRNPVLENYVYTHSEIEEIMVYTDNPNVVEYKQYYYADDEIQQTGWYEKAIQTASVFWTEMESFDRYQNSYWNLCLVRRIPMVQSDYHAVLVIRLSDNYLKTRVNSSEYQTYISADQGKIFYSSDKKVSGGEQFVDIDYEDRYFQYAGDETIDGRNCFVRVSALPLYQSDTKLYISTWSESSYESIQRIIYICAAIIIVALVIPGVVVYSYTQFFTGRVLTLRHVMHQVSNEEYDYKQMVQGKDELSEAFADLEVMVQKIKAKDAEVYETRLMEKELINEQQKMEFKMLASQINPHFLYNTLETIRMKAFTAGDREVATAIKLLGKSMRYVLENTGTNFTTLDKELEHVRTYMEIQKLRFGERFNYFIEIDEDIRAGHCEMLPLLLQPIVENAIVHGMEQVQEGGTIRITVVCDGEDKLLITVEDNGSGMDEETLEGLRKRLRETAVKRVSSIGLCNINQRINLCYGEEYGLHISSIPGCGTKITVKIPKKSDDV